MRDFVAYTAARFGLFAVTYAGVLLIVWLVTDGSLPVLWPLLVAAVISTVASAYLLRGLRDRFTQNVQTRAERMSTKFEEMKAKEDLD